MAAYPDLLKEWRKRRRMSQLDLAVEANVSARHISFLETGRSRPSPDMIAHLSDVLAVPVEARNRMMRAVGFAPRYGATSLDAKAMAPIRQALDWTLHRHAPYPAMVLDRLWRVVALNAPAGFLFAPFGVAEGASLLDLLIDPRLPDVIENWPEVAHATMLRLRAESSAAGGVPELERAAQLLAPMTQGTGEYWGQPSIPTIYRMGDQRLSLFGTIAHFSTIRDEALDDLKIELFFPADPASDAILKALEPQWST